MNLILASKSPRRKALLEQFRIPFSVEVLPTREVEHGEPLDVSRANAAGKAVPVSQVHPDFLVLGADTIVTLDGRILGKPKDAKDAQVMLTLLSGREHEVTTSVALCQGGRI